MAVSQIKTLYERVLAAVPAEQLPRLEKTGKTLVEAHREHADKLDWTTHSLEKFSISEEAYQQLLAMESEANDHLSSAKILEDVKDTTPAWRPVESATALPMLLEVDDEMCEMFLNLEEGTIYVPLNTVEYAPFTASFYAARVWMKTPPQMVWRVIA
jgi:hypothetical protein